MDVTGISVAWSSIIAIVAGAGVVTTGLAALAGWLVLRFTKPLDSYTDEFAKQVARHQNLEKLVEETRHVTDAAEKIKSGLSHENWDRQTRWSAKRELYVQIAQSLGDLSRAFVTMKELGHLGLTRDLTDPDYGPKFETMRQNGHRAMDIALLSFTRACDTAPMYVPAACFKPLQELKPRPIRFNTPDWESDLEYNIVGTKMALYHFQVAARVDLGFGPMEWAPRGVSAESPNQPEI